ncbi:MAG: hypothetical protein M5U07_25815 [Xanthobacteraceae bacterium]|nr:hypothetical protein [Xanthobacteraceae bacterium]
MRTRAAAGAVDALETAYQACARLLDAELGMKPSAETEAEYRRLRESRAAPAARRQLPQVRFACADGGSVAYASLDEGPALVVIPGFVSHIEMGWRSRACAASPSGSPTRTG